MSIGRSFSGPTAVAWAVLAVSTICLASNGVAQPAATSPAGATRILGWPTGNEGELYDQASGSVVLVPSLADISSPDGHRVQWKVLKSWNDGLGYDHVLYRQRLFPRHGSAPLPPGLARDGVPVEEGLLRFTFDEDGTLVSVYGGSFGEVGEVASLTFGNAVAAQAMAWREMEQAGYLMAQLPFLPRDLRSELEIDSTLTLRGTANGRSFHYVWRLPVVLEDMSRLVAHMDGESGRLLGVFDPNPHSLADCEPWCKQGAGRTCQETDSVPGDAQNGDPEVPDRTDLSAMASQRHPEYGWEAGRLVRPRPGHNDGTTRVPEIWIYRGKDSQHAGCSTSLTPPTKGANPDPKYRWYWDVLPVGLEAGQPKYADAPPDADYPDVPGKQGADAMHNTIRTMEGFWEIFRRFGYDGLGTPVAVTVDISVDTSIVNNAGFLLTGNQFAPAGVAIGRTRPPYHPSQPPEPSFSAAAALDVIAHEFGHGVVFTGVPGGFDDESEVRAALHEGFADVIGYAVELLKQPGPVTGDDAPLEFERPDWAYGEDQDSAHNPIRRTNSDDGAGAYSYHAADAPGVNASGVTPEHFLGHRLAVAFMLAARGGRNPVCDRLTLAGCDTTVESIGMGLEGDAVTRAAKVFYHIITDSMTSDTQWEDLPFLAMETAFRLYSNRRICYAAKGEQLTMKHAFAAIGYPGPIGVLGVCPVDIDHDS